MSKSFLSELFYKFHCSTNTTEHSCHIHPCHRHMHCSFTGSPLLLLRLHSANSKLLIFHGIYLLLRHPWYFYCVSNSSLVSESRCCSTGRSARAVQGQREPCSGRQFQRKKVQDPLRLSGVSAPPQTHPVFPTLVVAVATGSTGSTGSKTHLTWTFSTFNRELTSSRQQQPGVWF